MTPSRKRQAAMVGLAFCLSLACTLTARAVWKARGSGGEPWPKRKPPTRQSASRGRASSSRSGGDTAGPQCLLRRQRGEESKAPRKKAAASQTEHVDNLRADSALGAASTAGQPSN
eukprot:GHVT01040507.1.p4 GENE.GHVT01040507.1~~GHVT01040507.1.p4  ORF type:complete len:116 (-),score=28.58 GHVT01040507.1:1829-2176(-)